MLLHVCVMFIRYKWIYNLTYCTVSENSQIETELRAKYIYSEFRFLEVSKPQEFINLQNEILKLSWYNLCILLGYSYLTSSFHFQFLHHSKSCVAGAEIKELRLLDFPKSFTGNLVESLYHISNLKIPTIAVVKGIAVSISWFWLC